MTNYAAAKAEGKLEALADVERRLNWWINEHKASIEALKKGLKRKQEEAGDPELRPDAQSKRQFWQEEGALYSAEVILAHVKKQDVRDALKEKEEAGSNTPMQSFGITGGIAAGKSSVTKIVRRMGFPVVDADEVSRRVVEPGTEGLGLVIDTFGSEYLTDDGTLNRAKLGDLIFNDDAGREKLTEVLQPIMGREIMSDLFALARAGKKVAFVDAALLIEWGWHKWLHGIIVVTCPLQVRLARAAERDGVSPEKIGMRIAAQMVDDKKLQYADHEISNTGTPQDLYNRVVECLARISKETEHG